MPQPNGSCATPTIAPRIVLLASPPIDDRSFTLTGQSPNALALSRVLIQCYP